MEMIYSQLSTIYSQLFHQAYMLELLILVPLIFLAGFIDSIAGGGGLISLPAYLVAGLPPHTALANNKFSSVFGTSFSTARYFRHGMIDVKVAVISAFFALIGSFMGAKVVLSLDAFFLNYILIILLPIITVFTFIKKDLGKIDTSHQISILPKIIIASIMGLVIGFYDGFFGPGTGTFLILCFCLLLKYDLVSANGNTKVINLASNIAAVTTFIYNGNVLFSIGIPCALAGIGGNLLGSKFVVKKGNTFIRPVFLIVVVLLLVRIILNVI